jgi:surface antigen
MNTGAFFTLAAMLAFTAVPAGAHGIAFDESGSIADSGDAALPPYLQCVPYARQVTGISIFGDAHTWWDQAEGRYSRGLRPRIGAVMTFKPHGNSTLGHVAAVSRIVDSRTILIRHANWSPINGRRGQIEDNVEAVDVSPDNDWSEVRVWYAPIQGLGGAHWPVQGFIYPSKPSRAERLALTEKQAGPTQAAFRQLFARNPGTPSDPIAEIIGRRLGF